MCAANVLTSPYSNQATCKAIALIVPMCPADKVIIGFEIVGMKKFNWFKNPFIYVIIRNLNIYIYHFKKRKNS